MAQMVGESGRVIACDLQKEMLHKLRDKIPGRELEGRITLHKWQKNRIGVLEDIDSVFAFYMVYEVLNQEEVFL